MRYPKTRGRKKTADKKNSESFAAMRMAKKRGVVEMNRDNGVKCRLSKKDV
jgi:hypothetical protein